jgi:hypothetical protein
MARGMESEEPPETGDWGEAGCGKVLPDGGRRRVMLGLGCMGEGAIMGQRNTEGERVSRMDYGDASIYDDARININILYIHTIIPEVID